MSPAELRALLSLATPGPWVNGETSIFSGSFYARGAFIADLHCDAMGNALPEREHNTALIVAAVNALTELLDRIAALEADAEASRARHDEERWTADRNGFERAREQAALVASREGIQPRQRRALEARIRCLTWKREKIKP